MCSVCVLLLLVVVRLAALCWATHVDNVGEGFLKASAEFKHVSQAGRGLAKLADSLLHNDPALCQALNDLRQHHISSMLAVNAADAASLAE